MNNKMIFFTGLFFVLVAQTPVDGMLRPSGTLLAQSLKTGVAAGLLSSGKKMSFLPNQKPALQMLSSEKQCADLLPVQASRGAYRFMLSDYESARDRCAAENMIAQLERADEYTFLGKQFIAELEADHIRKKVLLLDEQPVGLVAYTFSAINVELGAYSVQDTVAEILCLIVDERYQNSGAGSVLLQNTLTDCRKEFQNDPVALCTTMCNHEEKVAHFFEKFGARQVPFPNHHAEVLFILREQAFGIFESICGW